VIMISALTQEGAEATLAALEYGALDFIVKQQIGAGVNLDKLEKELVEKVKTVARRRFFYRPMKAASAAASPPAYAPPRPAPTSPAARTPHSAPAAAISGAANFVRSAIPTGKPLTRDLLVIGVSTGGPPAVQRVLGELPKDFPVAIIIAQHMPAAFTGPFAKRLDGLCKISVKEAESGERAQPGCVYISPGGKHVRVQLDKGHLVMTVSSQPEDALYKPSANVLIESAASIMNRRVLGAVLTGMGNDGLEGAKVLKAKGGRLLAQSDSTCVVYGMPKAIVDASLADEIVDIEDMALAFQVNLFK
jgi:two-component system chemotaxis response regulator CheB